MRVRIRVPQVLVGVAILAFGALCAGLVAQYQFDMQPCAWCVLQRLIYIVIGVLALLAAALPGLLRRLFTGLALLGALWGVGTALYQQLHAVNEQSCDLSMAERFIAWLGLDQLLPQLFVAYASCADAAVSVLGIPFAVWSCLLYAILALLLGWSLRVSLRTR